MPRTKSRRIIFNYISANFDDSPILKQLVTRKTAETIELDNGICIDVRAASFRRLRGPTYVAVIADECAFFMSDEYSANADVEIINAIRPGLATTGGPLILASSPYAKRGILWDTFKRDYGKHGDPRVLVAKGPTLLFNQSLDPIVVHRALARDHASASAEYLAEFRNDLSAFVTYEMVAQCIGDYTEQAPLATHRPYHAFVDPSGGSSDSMTLAISHREGERIIVDAMREAVPPFSPESVVDDFAILIRSYGILRVVGDRYAGEWPREQFSKRGITYVCAEKTKSDLYRDLLPLLNSGRIVLPKSDRLVHQLTGLERRTSRAGKDSIDHAPGTKDDLGNSVAGCADLFNIRFVPVAPVQTTYTRHRSPAVSPIGKRLEEEARAAVPACLIDFSDPKNQWRFSND